MEETLSSAKTEAGQSTTVTPTDVSSTGGSEISLPDPLIGDPCMQHDDFTFATKSDPWGASQQILQANSGERLTTLMHPKP